MKKIILIILIFGSMIYLNAFSLDDNQKNKIVKVKQLFKNGLVEIKRNNNDIVLNAINSLDGLTVTKGYKNSKWTYYYQYSRKSKVYLFYIAKVSTAMKNKYQKLGMDIGYVFLFDMKQPKGKTNGKLNRIPYYGVADINKLVTFRAPAIITPKNNKEVVADNVRFTWIKVKDAKEYRVVFCRNGKFSDFVDNGLSSYSKSGGVCYDEVVKGKSTVEIGPLKINKLYTWKVRVENSDSEIGEWSEDKFRTIDEEVVDNTIENNEYYAPYEGQRCITQGWNGGYSHGTADGERYRKGAKLAYALDIAGVFDVLAVQDGEVVASGWNNGFGNYIIIKHDDGLYSQYAHLKKREVFKTHKVIRGERIGISGGTGSYAGATGKNNNGAKHLHLQFRKDSTLSTSMYGSIKVDFKGFSISKVNSLNSVACKSNQIKSSFNSLTKAND